MPTISLAQLGADFGANFQHSAYRLELLSYYDSQLYRDRLAGRPVDRSRWDGIIRGAVAAGKIIQRVHVMPDVLNPYLEHEIDFYQGSVLAGEDIRILPEAGAGDLELPYFDYWLFDSATAAVLEYDDAGICTAIDIRTEPEFVARCNTWRDAALARAITLADWEEGRKRAA